MSRLGLLRRDGKLLLPSFPNVTIIALRIQQTIGIAIEQGNAHFRRCRALKITLGPQRVNIGWIINLAVMSIESDLLRALDVTTLIGEFAHESENQQRQFYLMQLGLLDPEHEGKSNPMPFNNSM